jgi:hypothetical protein
VTHILVAVVLIFVVAGSLVLLGLLTMVRELFCDRILEAPSMPDGDAATERAEQSPSGLFLENTDH